MTNRSKPVTQQAAIDQSRVRPTNIFDYSIAYIPVLFQNTSDWIAQ